MTPTANRRISSGWTTALAALALILIAVTFVGGGTAVLVMVSSGAWAILWILSAAGFGWPLRHSLLPRTNHPHATQFALGVAGLLLLDVSLGKLGLLQLGGSLGAWMVTLIGVALLLAQLLRGWRTHRAGAGETLSSTSSEQPGRRIRPESLYLAAALPAIFLALLAACSAPGWLWSSEFGGYDALSYHLELPKEWLRLGRITGLEHNVYSYLPSYVEAAYYHVMILVGDPIEAATACQLLHAGIGVGSAAVIASAGRRLAGGAGGLAAGVFALGTPWFVIVTSLAYNEMFTLLMLAAGLLVFIEHDENGCTWTCAIAIGVFMGIACGAKLTAAGFVGLPLLALLLTMRCGLAKRLAALGLSVAVMLLALIPYLLSNVLETGNPLFPFMASALGHGHWTAEQAMIWTEGHQPDLSIPQRLVEGWRQLLRYGIGPSPYEDGERLQPWQPQWSILPWLAIAAGTAAVVRGRMRGWSLRLVVILLIQVVFWLAMTHVQSRFMLAGIVPMSLLVAMALAGGRVGHGYWRGSSRVGALVAAGDRPRRPGSDGNGWKRQLMPHLVVTLLLLVYSIVPVVLYAREGRGEPAWAMIGMTSLFTGDAYAQELESAELTRSERVKLLQFAPPALWLNHLLPDDAHVLGVGAAAPFYFRRDNFRYSTTWDRGALSRIMRDAPDDPEAWFEALRGEGFTHVLLDTTMLARWEAAGWNDPLLTRDRLLPALEHHAALIWHLPLTGLNLYRLETGNEEHFSTVQPSEFPE